MVDKKQNTIFSMGQPYHAIQKLHTATTLVIRQMQEAYLTSQN